MFQKNPNPKPKYVGVHKDWWAYLMYPLPDIYYYVVLTVAIYVES